MSTHRSIRAKARMFLAVFAVAAPCDAFAVQDRSAASGGIPQPPLQGLVADEVTGDPISSAVVGIVGTSFEVASGGLGEFVFPPNIPSGSLTVRAAAAGYVSTVQQVEVREDGSVFVQLLLPSISATLDELIVRGQPDGQVTDSPRTAADLLALQIPSARRAGGQVGNNAYEIRLRGQNSVNQSNDPVVVVDGVRVGNPGEALDVLSTIPASDVESIEILRGPSASLLYASFAANGVIAVTTRSGRDPVDR